MDTKKRPGLKGLLASRNKGGSSKEAPKTQPPVVLPPPLPPIDPGLQAMPNLKKRRLDHELKEGEVLLKRTINNKKQPRTPGIRGVHLWIVGMRLRYISLSGPGLLRQKWRVLPFHMMIQYGTHKEAVSITQCKPYSNLSFSQGTWSPFDAQDSPIYSCH